MNYTPPTLRLLEKEEKKEKEQEKEKEKKPKTIWFRDTKARNAIIGQLLRKEALIKCKNLENRELLLKLNECDKNTRTIENYLRKTQQLSSAVKLAIKSNEQDRRRYTGSFELNLLIIEQTNTEIQKLKNAQLILSVTKDNKKNQIISDGIDVEKIKSSVLTNKQFDLSTHTLFEDLTLESKKTLAEPSQECKEYESLILQIQKENQDLLGLPTTYKPLPLLLSSSSSSSSSLNTSLIVHKNGDGQRTGNGTKTGEGTGTGTETGRE